MSLECKNLRCEYLSNPLGIDVKIPRLSWTLESNERGQKQTAYHILVASAVEKLKKDEGDIWDSGKINSDKTIQLEYRGKPLESQNFYYWKVMVWDKNEKPSYWSEIAYWSMGLLHQDDWKAKWIGVNPRKCIGNVRQILPKRKYKPSPLLRKEFSINNKIKKAIVYVTSLGDYELYLNGERVSDHFLSPEWTDYNKRVQYQTYDVTNSLKEGENAIAATLADGWYNGNLGPFGTLHNYYGVARLLLFQMSIVFLNGDSIEIISDDSWKIDEDGPIRKSDHFKGEIYDEKKEQKGWNLPGFNDSHWSKVITDNSIKTELVAQMNEPIRIVKKITPVEMIETKRGIYIFNLGQNITGWCSLRLDNEICKKDAVIRVRHGEKLNSKRKLFRENLGLAKATDIYILNGLEAREYHPHFTYHGFQYIEISGLKKGVKPELDMITGCAIASDCKTTLKLDSSDSTLNKLIQNIIWAQRDNMISVPTDCPQRSERMGWMGDTTGFAQTAIFNMDMAAFYSKWIRDIRDAQDKYGRYPDFVPFPNNKFHKNFRCAPGWADCGIVLPWLIYLNYNDIRILEEHYESAKKFIDHIRAKNPNLIWINSIGHNYADWLNGDTIISKDYPKIPAAVPADLFATGFFANSTLIVAKMANVLGNDEDYWKYYDLANKICEQFCDTFIGSDQKLKGDTQAGYALALNFELLPEDYRPQAFKNMIDAIERFNGRLSTGFLSTIPLMFELVRKGLLEKAYHFLFNRKLPSWFYMIDQGATTLWERWDGDKHAKYLEHRFRHIIRILKNMSLMNSFNHFAFGAIGEFICKIILGLDIDESRPGYKNILIKPQPGGGLKWVKGSYDSIHGIITVNWKMENDGFELEVIIPPNTTGTLYLPTGNAKNVNESGNALDSISDIEIISSKEKVLCVKINSGNYKFSVSND